MDEKTLVAKVRKEILKETPYFSWENFRYKSPLCSKKVDKAIELALQMSKVENKVPVVSKKRSEETAWKMFMFGVAYTQTHPDMKLLKDWTDEEEVKFKKEINNLIRKKAEKLKGEKLLNDA